MLGRLATTIGDLGGNLAMIDAFEAKGVEIERDININCEDEAHQLRIVEAIRNIDGVTVHDWYDRTFHMHRGGKIATKPLAPVGDYEDLSMAYTPGVARVCLAIAQDPVKARTFTIKRNTVGIVTDGTAVLGLGDIGPLAALPVMEGKALLFKEFAGIDAFPICLDTKDPDEIVETVERIAPTFGGINLEDIAAPGAFDIEERLKASLDIPVFHDDQHGTAVVTLAALENALKITGKAMSDLRIVISGVGAAGMAIGKILLNAGAGHIVGADRKGAVYVGREGLNYAKQWFAEHTNHEGLQGSLRDVIRGADVFIGVSAPGVLHREDVVSMAKDPIVFAMANPDPEITPEDAGDAAAIMATGRSDFPNQINNVLAFPGIFRGAFDVAATDITEGMKLAAAGALAEVIPEEELAPDYIIPSVFNKDVVGPVADAVGAAAIAEGVVS
jgi:malate dehydrogenase (oxaloacetate-decarboxylating)